MGTRSITYFQDAESDTPMCALYRQYDGYVSGHGHELATFLNSKPVTNGIRMNNTGKHAVCFNGLGGLAAQTIGRFDATEGNFYIVPVDNGDEEYAYVVKVAAPILFNDKGTITIIVRRWGEQIFCGSPSELLSFNEPNE